VKKNIEISEVFTIDTDENRCALLFCLQLQHQLDDAKMLFLTANNFDLVHDNLERIKPYLSYFDTLHLRTKHLFLKDSWLNLDAQYGIRALSNELSSLVEHSEEKLFFLHRVDLFFDKVFNTELEDVMIAFIKDIRYHHKKVIFSYNSKTVTGKAFDELLDKRRDISYHIQEDKDDPTGDCFSTIKTYNKFLKKPYAEIVLISDDSSMINMHKRVFSNQKDIHFSHLSLKDLVDSKDRIHEEADVVIYDDRDITMDERMVKYLKGFAHFARIYQLSDKKFLRKTDLGQAQEMGIDYVAPYNFDIKEYISSIESVIENDFYTQKLKDFYSKSWQQEVDYEGLKNYLLALREAQIIFSLLRVPTEEIVVDDVVSMIREEDCIYHDKEKESLVFVLINILGDNAKEILAKRLKIKKRHITLYHDIAAE
jgi:hypothetical protein